MLFRLLGPVLPCSQLGELSLVNPAEMISHLLITGNVDTDREPISICGLFQCHQPLLRTHQYYLLGKRWPSIGEELHKSRGIRGSGSHLQEKR